MSTITMYHKDGRSIPVNSCKESIERMKANGFSESKPTKKKKPVKKAD